jgi:hypothetical protein
MMTVTPENGITSPRGKNTMPEDAHDKPPQVKIKGIDIGADEVQDFQVPSFVNYVYAWQYGNDLYVDMGLLTIEQMDAFKPGGGSEVKVAMYNRFVMSAITFEDLYRRMNLVRERLRSQGLVRDEVAEAPKVP